MLTLTWAFMIKLGVYIYTNASAGRDMGQEEQRMTEDEMAGWHH